MRGRSIIALAALAAVALPAGSSEARATVERGQVDLRPTGVDPDASGRAKLQVRGGSDGRFDVEVKRLDRQATYEVIVESVRVGAVTTSRGGSGRLRFRSHPRSRRDDFLGFDPRGVALTIRNAAGNDVLAATVPVTSVSGGEGKVVCCVPDDSGAECEDRTPDECAAEGGTVSSAASCLPNPCAGTPPPAGADVVCCIPDDGGPECEDRTPAECASEGGVAIEAAACAPNPCAATPSADPDIRCCLPDDSGPECEDRTPAQCIVQGGVDLGAGSCTPDPCGSVAPPPGGGTASVKVTCERRASRSKVSVDGGNLGAGLYRARVVSGANEAASGLQAAVAGEVELDFDSDPGDIAAGATPIAASFLTGTPPQALGQLLDPQGGVVAEALATCRSR